MKPAAGRSGATGADASFITVEGVSKTYATSDDSEVTAVAEVSCVIDAGEFVSIVGPSGCGKTTLLKMIGGLLPPTTGSIRYSGADAAPDLGMVFQDAVLLPWRTVLENILLPAEVARLDRAESEEAARRLVELVGLKGFESRYPSELSGGMQQRVSIARALLNRPKLLLMDEPFGALDAMTREQMGQELERIWAGSKATVVFITHSIPEAVLLSDRVFAMTTRPSRVAEIVDIDLPRPRSLRMAGDDKFVRYTNQIRALLLASGDL
ncbi:MAG: ABC transporter ATP-binding protein [Rhodospirillales bacterium]|nr:ABC transporter ATP-binding protein [Rhodospirillales bacterium]